MYSDIYHSIVFLSQKRQLENFKLKFQVEIEISNLETESARCSSL